MRQPRPHAYCAIAEPSSCATLPKLNASLPFAPKRFGPIWSVPMHGATASTPRLIASCTTGAAKSTSHVVKMMFAPPLEQLQRARLRDRRLVALRVAGLDLDLASVDAAPRVHLLDAQLGRRERRPVERRHRALAVERPADRDRRRLVRRRPSGGRRCERDERDRGDGNNEPHTGTPSPHLVSSTPWGVRCHGPAPLERRRVRVRASPPPAPPRTSPGTRFRTCRRRRRSRCRTGRPSPRRRARAGSSGTSATPSPGSARSAHPRVGSRQSQMCTPAKRSISARCRRRASACSRGATRRTGSRATASRRRPRSARPPPGSTRRSSRARRRRAGTARARSAGRAGRPRARSSGGRRRRRSCASSGSRPSPVPVRQTNAARAERREPLEARAERVDRARPGPPGPPSSGSGRIDGNGRNGGCRRRDRSPRAARAPRRRRRRRASTPRRRCRRDPPRRRGERRRRSSTGPS